MRQKDKNLSVGDEAEGIAPDRQQRGESGGEQTEETEKGEQVLVPGVAAVSQRGKLESRMKKPMQGGDAPADGLFSSERDQSDMFGGGADLARTNKPISESATTPETLANWRRSVESAGTARGWKIFNDRVGGGYVLMTDERMVSSFANKMEARAYAAKNPQKGDEAQQTADPQKPAKESPETEALDLRAERQPVR